MNENDRIIADRLSHASRSGKRGLGPARLQRCPPTIPLQLNVLLEWPGTRASAGGDGRVFAPGRRRHLPAP